MIDFEMIYNSVVGEINDGFGDESSDLTNNALAELIERLYQTEKDAARYRWLRDFACTNDIGEFDNALRKNRDSLLDDLMNA